MQNWPYWKYNLLEAPSLHLAKEWTIIHMLVPAYKPFLRNKYLNLSNNRVWYFQPEAFNRGTFLEKLKPKQSTFQSLFCGMNKVSFKNVKGSQTCVAPRDTIPAWKMPPGCPSSQALNTAGPKKPYFLRAKLSHPWLQAEHLLLILFRAVKNRGNLWP